MKKVIVAAAGLMLVGTMATSAMAEFKFSGDARARFFLQNDYDEISGFASDDDTRWNSRIRFNVQADTKGGAYAIARLRAGNHTWGTFNPNNGQSVDVDRAYIGVPMGPVVVEAGRQPRDITPFLVYGENVDGVDVSYKTDVTTVVAFYDMIDEDLADANDDDASLLGAVFAQKFDGGWGLLVGGLWSDDNTVSPEQDGIAATAQVTGALGSVALTAELAFEEEENILHSGSVTDDGWGGYVSAAVPVGPAEVTGTLGFTADGFAYDQGDFGPFEIIGDVNDINTGFNPSVEGETVFVVLNPSYKATEDLTLSAVLAYFNVDQYPSNGTSEFDMFEISGRVTYAVTDGANLFATAGFLDTDDLTQDDPFGVGVGLKLSF